MKFKHPLDTKSFLIGICASIMAVIIWDVYKYEKRLLAHKNQPK